MKIEEIKKRCEAAKRGDQRAVYYSDVFSRTDIPDLITAYKRQKNRADHLFKQVPALKKHIEELENSINELGILIKTKDFAFGQLIKSCDESEAERLRKEKHTLQQLWVTVNLSCGPPEDCNNPAVLKRYMKACIDKADEYKAMKKDEE